MSECACAGDGSRVWGDRPPCAAWRAGDGQVCRVSGVSSVCVCACMRVMGHVSVCVCVCACAGVRTQLATL